MIKLKKHILLMGFMGSGKTTIAHRLSSKYSISCLDLDLQIEQDEGQSIKSIFASRGESGFREVETRTLKAVLNGEPKLVALGGGTPCQAQNGVHIFNPANLSIYLKYDADLLAQRLFLQRDKRPLLLELDTIPKLENFIQIKLAERSPFYEKADFIISNESNLDHTIDSITNYIQFNNLIDQQSH